MSEREPKSGGLRRDERSGVKNVDPLHALLDLRVSQNEWPERPYRQRLFT